MQPYTNSGVVPFDGNPDPVSLKDKTAMVTGGANGIGEAYTLALLKAGAYVVVADLDSIAGEALENQYPGKIKFVQCNVTKWADQVAVFDATLALSPSGMIDVVIPNAGIDGADGIFFTDLAKPPVEPRLDILTINLTGAMYTIKLALHHFRRQNAQQPPSSPKRFDLILQGSLAGYLDLPGAPEYSATKFAMRGIMRDLRRTEWQHNIRVNYIGPWFVRTRILGAAVLQHLESAGVEFATVDDAAAALMTVLSDARIVGRALAVVPRTVVPSGFFDLDADDYSQGSVLKMMQDKVEDVDNRSKINAEAQKTAHQA